MGAYEKSIVGMLNYLENLNPEPVHYSYSLTHTYDPKKRRFYVEAPYKAEVFYALCAYIEFQSENYDMSYSMDQTEIIEVLEKFYGCRAAKRQRSLTVDLYVNRECFCGSGLDEVQVLKREGMDELLKSYVDRYRVKEIV